MNLYVGESELSKKIVVRIGMHHDMLMIYY